MAIINYYKLNEASEKEQLKAVKRIGSSIKFIKNPSVKVQLEAIKKNIYAIQFIEIPSSATISLCVKLLKREIK
jgi:23S rRNA A1618 N6-methylase RlmF